MMHTSLIKIEQSKLKITEKILALSLYAILLTPFAVGLPFIKGLFDLANKFSIVHFQRLYFELVIIVIFYSWFYLKRKNQKATKFITPLSSSIIIFLSILIVTALAGDNPARSFFSTPERQVGVLFYFLLFIYFVALSDAIRCGIINKEKYLFANVIVATAVAMIGILQCKASWLINIIYSPLLTILPEVTRPGSVVGNPTFLSGYLLSAIFMCQYFFIKKKLIPFIILALLVCVYTLFLTQTRGGIIGLAGGVCFLIFCFIKEKKIKTSLSIIVATSLFVILIFGKTDVSERFNRINIDNNNRVAQWGIAWKGFKDHPLLGYGPENFVIPMYKYGGDVYLKNHVERIDKPHNVYIEYLATTGIAGFVAFITLGITAYRAIIPRYKALFGPCLVAYALQCIFIFDTIIGLLQLVMLLSLIKSDEKETLCGTCF